MTKRYFFPVHRMDAYRDSARRSLQVTDYLYDRLLCVPLYHDLTDESIGAIAQLIIEAVGSVEVHSLAMQKSAPPTSYQAEVA